VLGGRRRRPADRGTTDEFQLSNIGSETRSHEPSTNRDEVLAFAAVALQSTRDLAIDDSTVNVNGAAISMGHPVGCSGARIALHLALELGRRGGGLGAAGLCGGGGQGEALLLRVAG
jgi:Thiolase, C-terminal domain